jgi:hypothetical protein
MKLSALNHKDFRIYVAGNLFALNALWMQRITIGWIAWELTRSAKFNSRRVSMTKSILTIVILFVLTACDIPFIPGI